MPRNRECAVGPGQGVHVADSYVGLRVAVTGHLDQARRRVDAGAHRAAGPGEFDGQSGTARNVQHPVPGADAQTLVQRDVLTGVPGLAHRREVDGPAPPALVDERPLRCIVDLGFELVAVHARHVRAIAWS